MSGFYGYAWQAFRQNGGFIGGILTVEYIGRRHGNDVHGDTLFCQYFLRFQSQFNFRTGRNYNSLRITLSFTDYISTAFDVVQLLFITRLEFQVLTAENQAGRMIGRFNGFRPRYQRFNGIAWTPYIHIRNQAQSGSLLDRLVGRTVFTQTDGIVGEHKYGVDFHQRSHAQGIAFVFAEHQESRAEGFHTTMQGKAVHDRSHTELAHAVVNIVAAVLSGNGNAV